MTDVFSALSGSGDVLLPSARFVPLIGVEVTTLPPGYAVMDLTVPRRVMKVGWVSPGRLGSDPSWPASLFFEDARWIDFERELMTYPAPGVYCDRIRYHIEPGGVATLYVNDTGVPAVLNNTLQSFDRNPLQVNYYVGAAVAGGTALTTGFAYTVPTGRKFQLQRIVCKIQRVTVAGTLAYSAAQVVLHGVVLAESLLYGNVVGDNRADGGSSAGVVLTAGKVVVGKYINTDTGGLVDVAVGIAGTEFDA